ncbi:MAG: phosphoenolpyruvate carboxykinase, partial [Polyangiaceae bacterium]|nr:phosphoenolpyruvate carboxykinase [Polyangiaceae bacterium]
MTNAAPTKNPTLLAWVEQMASLTKPDQIVWCDGSEDEQRRLTELAVAQGVLEPLNPDLRPG